MGSPERRSSETGAVEPEVPPCCSSSLFPELSVLMPVRNALPWLCDAVGSVLAQRGVRLELIAVDDGSTDGSLAWLRACASALAARPGRGTTAYDRVVEEAAVLPWEAHAAPTLDPTEVAARAQPGASLRVLSVAAPRGLSGQGLALNTALCASTAQLVGEMEADDLRPPHAFAALRDALAAHPGWGGATSRVALAGWPRPGMQRWVDWQNGVGCGPGGAAELAFNRFVEIPAMRAAGLYRRKALLSLGSRPYRDLWALPCGTLVDAAAGEEGEADWEWSGGDTVATAPLPDCVASAPLPGWWPVDTDFFGRWFDRGLVMGKLPEALYVWRQARASGAPFLCSLSRHRPILC